MGFWSAHEDEWVACRICGHPNRPHKTWQYRACPRCFHDAKTGDYDKSQAAYGKLVLFGTYFMSAFAGMAVAMLTIALPLTIILDLGSPEVGNLRILLLGAILGAGAAVGTWIAERQRRRGGFEGVPPAALAMPEGASKHKRVDTRYIRPMAGAALAFIAVAFPLGIYVEAQGAPDWSVWLTTVLVTGAGAAAGHVYDLHRRGGGGR